MKPHLLWLVLCVLAPSLGCEDPAATTALNSEIALAPEQLHILALSDAPREGAVSLRAIGRAQVLMRGVSVSGVSGPFTMEARLSADQLAPGAALEISVIVTPTGEPGFGGAQILVETDAGELTLPVSVEVRPLPDCDDGNPCTHDVVDRENASCTHADVVNSTPCDDGNACTEHTVCADGRCLGSPIVCEDTLGCTIDACEPESGCVFVPDHARCDDGDPCTDEVCADQGCINPDEPPGTVCALNGCETIGLCFGGDCVETAVPDGVPCEDGDLCTNHDTCQAGTCEPGERAEIGAAEPLSLDVGAPVVASCDLLLEGGGGCGARSSPLEAVLAARVDGEAIELVWRSTFTDQNHAPCDPKFYPLNSTNNIDPPEDDDGANEALTPVPPQPNYCAAPIFRTRTTPEGLDTRHIASTQRQVAADFDGEVLVLAHAGSDQSGVWYERIDAADVRAAIFIGTPEVSPIGEVAISGSVILAGPLQRTASPFDDDDGPMEVPLLLVERSPAGIEQRARLGVPEFIPAECDLGFNPGSPRRLDLDLQVRAGLDEVRVLARGRRDGCPGSVAPVRLFTASVPRGGFANQGMLEVQATPQHDFRWAELEQDRVTVVRRSGELDELVLLTFDGGARSFGPVLSGDLAQGFSFEIQGLTRAAVLNSEVRTELRWTDPLAGEVTHSSSPAEFLLDREQSFVRASGLNAPDLVVGAADAFMGCPPGTSDEVDCALMEYRTAAVASFGCVAEPWAACSTDDDCGAGEHCETAGDHGVCQPD